MVTVSRIMTDDKSRPLNKQGQPVKGLFAYGDTLGALWPVIQHTLRRQQYRYGHETRMVGS